MSDTLDPRWAWAPYKPSADNPWDLKKAGHLYRRAAFGATWAELHAAHEGGPDKAVAGILAGGEPSAEFTATAATMDRISRQNTAQARGWWITRMLEGPHPLREKLTLLWHNHFATSVAKVQSAARMFGQYELMHRHALGNFATLLQEMSKDPAMMVWLDTVQSKKGMPNENYARELMELFSLGIGNFTETDIREAAKAFTGWEIKDEKFFFNVAQSDDGPKKVLGRAGKLKGEDVVDLCLKQPACAKFIVRKLLRFLVSDTLVATDELIGPLAKSFRTGYDFGKLVETVLRSNLFFSPYAYRQRIKAPVDFALGMVRGLELRVSAIALATALESLGQNLFAPPSVKGWDGGPTWLNGQTLLFRQNLALALCSRDARYVRRPEPGVVAEPADLLAKHHAEPVAFLLDLFLQGDVPTETRQKLTDYLAQARTAKLPVYWTSADRDHHPTQALCHLVLTLPEFQLD
ncbi:MAG: DUF1800 domain-containing protein [Gemmataceae bacterium]